MTESQVLTCPRCYGRMNKHCESHSCTWWTCVDRKLCRTYGDPITKRWAQGPVVSGK